MSAPYYLPKLARAFVAGLDLGQANDYTALAIAEVLTPEDGPPLLEVGHLERMRGVRYPEIVRTVKGRLVALTTPYPPATVRMALDRTGVGRAVGDAFIEAELPCDLVQLTIHGGDAVTEDDAGFRVPKRDLVGATQRMLQESRLTVASVLPLAQAFVEEATNFKVTINDRGHDSYAAWREAQHDDLVLSVAMLCWLVAERPVSPTRQYSYLNQSGGFRTEHDDDDDDDWPGPSWRS
jgi:hypothetical protein